MEVYNMGMNTEKLKKVAEKRQIEDMRVKDFLHKFYGFLGGMDIDISELSKIVGKDNIYHYKKRFFTPEGLCGYNKMPLLYVLPILFTSKRLNGYKIIIEVDNGVKKGFMKVFLYSYMILIVSRDGIKIEIDGKDKTKQVMKLAEIKPKNRWERISYGLGLYIKFMDGKEEWLKQYMKRIRKGRSYESIVNSLLNQKALIKNDIQVIYKQVEDKVKIKIDKRGVVYEK